MAVILRKTNNNIAVGYVKGLKLVANNYFKKKYLIYVMSKKNMFHYMEFAYHLSKNISNSGQYQKSLLIRIILKVIFVIFLFLQGIIIIIMSHSIDPV